MPSHRAGFLSLLFAFSDILQSYAKSAEGHKTHYFLPQSLGNSTNLKLAVFCLGK